jgi:hypothetical protein
MALNFGGMNLAHPVNRIKAGMAALAVNVRNYLKGAFTLRTLLTDAIVTVSNAITTIARLNDSTPNGPSSGFTLIIAAGSKLYNNSTQVASGLSGDPVSMVPFRPNTSVQPWMYVADSAAQGSVTLNTKYLTTGAAVNFTSNGLLKVRSDGLAYKMGVKEPQLAPVVSTENTNLITAGSLLATAIPWTNYLGANSSYNYGETLGYPDPTPDGTAPFIIDCLNATFITITSLTGSATINGGAATPTTLGPSPAAATNPGHYVSAQGTGATPPASASVVIGAFCDGSGNVLPAGLAPRYIPSVVDVGGSIGVQLTVPYNAVTFQVGINSNGNVTGPGFSSNSGSFALSATVTTNALPSVLSVFGNLTAYYWGDSPHSGPTGHYIWKNPDDPGGSGPIRSIANAGIAGPGGIGGASTVTSLPPGFTTGNSFVFDCTVTAGVPGTPGIGSPSTPLSWIQINPDSSVGGSKPVFTPALESDGYADFNISIIGEIFVPTAGIYTFTMTADNDAMFGIGGGATWAGKGGITGDAGQTETVISGLPLVGSGTSATVAVNFSSAGAYQIEVDYDYWYHSGRMLLLVASPTPTAAAVTIPPLPIGVRQQVQYRYVYRSSATGAQSNPSPESSAQSIPVLANTITSLWSSDPQIDVVDYYRMDSVTTSFTYVATGPNDDLGGGGTNTPITDALLDTQLGNQLLSEDNFEPFPSIDLPQKGTCDVSGGVISWVSGGAIGGSATGFNPRWLAGTTILIGSPTSLAYVLIARPIANTIAIPGVPNGTGLQYEINAPIIANQPLPYLFGPTDNINFTFAVGDPLRSGTLYWCKGSNLDAAPDTNQMDVTDPGEPLVNGAMSAGRGALFSIKRAWVIMPNFFNALATATGTQGSTWSLQATSINRGLFIPRCLAVEGGGNIFFRVDDGIHVSPGGLESKSITDETMYPLFSHEGSTPAAVTRNGVTIYPPDDSQPQKQSFSINGAYLYYDYVDTGNTPRTLVFDMAAMGWIWDTYSSPATVHAPSEGESEQGVLVGCADGTVREMSSSGTEAVTGTVLSPAMGGRGFIHVGQLVIEYTSSSEVTLTIIPADSGNGSYGPPAITLPSTGGEVTKYWLRPGANKAKWFQFQFQSTDPTMQIFIEGCVAYVKPWGSGEAYSPVPIFGGQGGEG